MILELLLLLLLILANGVFSMAEIAVVSARRTRLQSRAEAGDAGAKRALELAQHPNRFLATVQIGITLVGIFAGAYGGATLAGELDLALQRFPAIAAYSGQLALALVVAGITYLTLVVGELVPKRIGLSHPESIAAVVARPMHLLSVAAAPVVKVLSVSTDGLLRLFRVRKANEAPVTEEEVAALIRQGAETGVFEEEERELVEGVFWLGDRRVAELMTPRHRVVWLDLSEPLEQSLDKMIRHPHSRFPACEGELDSVLGIVDIRDLWPRTLAREPLDLRAALREPLFVPEGLRALRLLDRFWESGTPFAMVVDEYGSIAGLITLNDVLEEISGDVIPTTGPEVVERGPGSWLMDGGLTMAEFRAAVELAEDVGEAEWGYHTLAGFVVTRLGHIPVAGESFEAFGLRFEVVDMDGHRVDKLLVTRVAPEGDGRED